MVCKGDNWMRGKRRLEPACDRHLIVIGMSLTVGILLGFRGSDVRSARLTALSKFPSACREEASK